MLPELINKPTRLYRVMVVDAAGRPICGDGDNMLGARVPIDIRPDAEGMVGPGRGGMSVSPDDHATSRSSACPSAWVAKERFRCFRSSHPSSDRDSPTEPTPSDRRSTDS
jgi:hypothetical protein